MRRLFGFSAFVVWASLLGSPLVVSAAGSSSNSHGKQKRTGITGDAAKGAVAPVGKSMIPGSSGPDADIAWANLMQLLTPTSALPVLTRKEVEPRDLTSAGRYHLASEAAKEFYTTYPKDFRADAARKYEAIAELQGVQLGGTRRSENAVALGSAFRGDKKNKTDDRIEVALAMETMSLPKSLNGRAVQDSPDVREAMIDRLYAEFGDADKIYGLYAGLMRTSDTKNARRIAAKITAKNPPAWAKTQANTFLDGAALIGKPAPVTFSSVAGRSLAVATDTVPTVVCFWSGKRKVADLGALQAATRGLTAKANWIYEALGVSTASLANVAALVPFAGEYCFEPDGFKSNTAKALKVPHTPWVCVFNAKGQLVGSGQVSELSELLAAAQ